MASQAEYHLVRIAFDMANPGEPIIDKLTSQTPQFWRGNDVRFQVSIFRNGEVLDVGNLSSITLEIRTATNITSAPLMQKAVAGGALDNTVTDATWADNTKQHATFDFTAAETNLTSPGSSYTSTWQTIHYIVLSAVTSGGKILTYQAGAIIFREDGAGTAGSPPTNDPNYYTIPQVDAGFVAKTGSTMSGLLVLSADPTGVLGAATKQYVDAATTNVALKIPVRASSTATVTIAAPGATIDGITMAASDRVLLKNQSTAAENGLYLWNGAATPMTRSADANSSALMPAGVQVFVNEGTVNADRTFKLTTNDPITLGTTALTFTQTSALGQVTLPAGLSKTGSGTPEVPIWDAAVHSTPAGVAVTTAGTAALPSVTRSTDLDTGLSFPAANELAASVGGAEVTRLTATGLGVKTTTPAFDLDVTGQVRSTSRVIGQSFENALPAIQVLDVAVATIAANNLPFPDTGQVVMVAAGTINTVTNVRAGVVYFIVATGAVTLTDSANIVGRGGNVVLAADEAITVLGLAPTKVALIGSTNGHRVGSGSAASPTIFFDAETNMGLYRSAASMIGIAFAGTERVKLGVSGTEILLEVPTYNFIINPADLTAGRGNIGLWAASSYGSGSGMISMSMLSDRGGVTPTSNETDNLLLWSDYDGLVAPALHIKSNAIRHVIGGQNVNFFDGVTTTSYTFGVKSVSSAFYANGTLAFWLSSHGSGATNCASLRMRRSSGTHAAPSAVASGDTIAKQMVEGYGVGGYNETFRFSAIAQETFTAAAAGADMVWSSCPLGSVTLTERLRLTTGGNFLFHGATSPASLAKGIVMGSGTDATADPSSASALWSNLGWSYRTSITSEGAGQTNRMHNRGEQVVGAGTNYTLTASMAQVTFGTTSPTVTLPTAGTYKVKAIIGCAADATTAADNVSFKLYNSTDAADASIISRITFRATSAPYQCVLEAIITVTAAKTIQIYAQNVTAARGVATSTETVINFVRLH